MMGHMREWFSAREIAAMELPGLSKIDTSLIKKAKRENWVSRPRTGRGGGLEYHVGNLPRSAREELVRRHLSSGETAIVPAQTAVVPSETLHFAAWQRETMQARLAVLAELERIVLHHGLTKKDAIAVFLDLAGKGQLSEALANQISVANAKSGRKGKRTVSRATLFNWMKAHRIEGAVGLIPRPARSEELVPEWAGDFLKCYGLPSKPGISQALQLMAQKGLAVPPIGRVKRFLKKLTPQDRNRGRMGPREMKAMQAYVQRDVSELWPTAVYSADGHSFDAEVQHPFHGRPFRPEITSVVDVFSRKCVGWSAALSENTFSVLDAARHAFEKNGLCDIWYVDLGKGFNNAAWDNQLAGFLPRLQITKKNSLPYNSQARGVCERLHQSIWVRGAKTFASYLGADMDQQARQKSYKLTRKDVQSFGTSARLKPWRDFVDWCQEQVDDYNARPHSGLPRIIDPTTGKSRHMSPDEVWEQAQARGWAPDRLSAQEAMDIYRPYVERSVERGYVKLFTNSYFAPELVAFHNEGRYADEGRVLVGYDIHDPEKVWVRDLQHRLICVAHWNGNSRAYFPVSVAQHAHEKRIKGRLKRNEAQRLEIEAERAGGLISADTLDVLPPLNAVEQPRQDAILLELAEARKSAPRPETAEDRYKRARALEKQRDISTDDQAWLARYQQSSEYIVHREYYEEEALTG